MPLPNPWGQTWCKFIYSIEKSNLVEHAGTRGFAPVKLASIAFQISSLPTPSPISFSSLRSVVLGNMFESLLVEASQNFNVNTPRVFWVRTFIKSRINSHFSLLPWNSWRPNYRTALNSQVIWSNFITIPHQNVPHWSRVYNHQNHKTNSRRNAKAIISAGEPEHGTVYRSRFLAAATRLFTTGQAENLERTQLSTLCRAKSCALWLGCRCVLAWCWSEFIWPLVYDCTGPCLCVPRICLYCPPPPTPCHPLYSSSGERGQRAIARCLNVFVFTGSRIDLEPILILVTSAVTKILLAFLLCAFVRRGAASLGRSPSSGEIKFNKWPVCFVHRNQGKESEVGAARICFQPWVL